MPTNASKFRVVIIGEEITVALYGSDHLSVVATLTDDEAEQLSYELATAYLEKHGKPATLEMFEKEGGGIGPPLIHRRYAVGVPS